MPVKGFEGLYEVSENGDVISLERTVQNRGRMMRVKGTVLKPSENDWGYKIVNLYKDGKQHGKQVHRLVAEAFIYPFSGEQVNHIDGNKYNNSVENLEWCSGSENMEHAYKNGLHSKATPVRIVELDTVFPSISEAARYVDGKVSGIWRCLSGRNKTHRGYHFEPYKEDT
jgi:hypothetical protein